jgi:hypothetical protein
VARRYEACCREIASALGADAPSRSRDGVVAGGGSGLELMLWEKDAK